MLGFEPHCNYVISTIRKGKSFRKLCRKDIGGDYYLQNVRVDLCTEHARYLRATMTQQLDQY